MDSLSEEAFYDKVGKMIGWDFSQVQCKTEGVILDFHEEILRRSKSTDVLLDIGTGGGESLLELASHVHLLIGIDLSKEMIAKAKESLRATEANNVKFFQMDSESLQFPSGFFDMITSRQAPFSAEQVFRTLKKGGMFLSQQVGEADKLNIKKAFGRGQGFHNKDGLLKECYIKKLYEAGFTKVQSIEYDAIEYYQRPEDLLFLLTHTPIVPNFGQEKQDDEILASFIKENLTDQGIRTNCQRFLIMAEK